MWLNLFILWWQCWSVRNIPLFQVWRMKERGHQKFFYRKMKRREEILGKLDQSGNSPFSFLLSLTLPSLHFFLFFKNKDFKLFTILKLIPIFEIEKHKTPYLFKYYKVHSHTLIFPSPQSFYPSRYSTC